MSTRLPRPAGTVYRAADAFPRGDGEGDAAVAAAGEDERESAVASVEEQEAAGMRVFQQYVIGMLTNFDSLPLERIHNMLKMFVSDPPYDKSLQQVRERGRGFGEQLLWTLCPLETQQIRIHHSSLGGPAILCRLIHDVKPCLSPPSARSWRHSSGAS